MSSTEPETTPFTTFRLISVQMTDPEGITVRIQIFFVPPYIAQGKKRKERVQYKNKGLELHPQ